MNKVKEKKSNKKKGYYEVEAILEHRSVSNHIGRQIELHVKWKGYEETTWEEFCRFAQDSPRCIEKYFNKINRENKGNLEKLKQLKNMKRRKFRN